MEVLYAKIQCNVPLEASCRFGLRYKTCCFTVVVQMTFLIQVHVTSPNFTEVALLSYSLCLNCLRYVLLNMFKIRFELSWLQNYDFSVTY